MAAKRILIFSLAYYPMVGGAEVAIKEITDRLPHIEFDMITLRFDRSPREQKIGNVTVYRIGGGLGYFSKILFIPQAASRTFLLHREKKYDLFWAMMSYMVFPIILMRMFNDRTPYVLTLQDGDPFEHVFERKRIKIFMPLLEKGFREARVIQTISNFLADWAKKIGTEARIEVIPNGVEVEKFESHEEKVSHDDVILITTSRLVEKNGVGDIIEALKFLPEKYKLEIIGSGPLETELRQKTEHLHLESRVKFRNFVSQDEIPKHLHEADIFVRPSLSEGQGISFIEAMAAGLPVIATPVGGIVDFVRDGETGCYAKVHDPESIAKQVERLMSDENLRKKIIENGKQLVKEKYQWNLITEKMESKVFAT